MSIGSESVKVSVIIPVYNMEKYLCECLDTVISQTLWEIEILCINDGSTDSSEELIKGYAAKDSRIKLITQENGGAASARNNGLRNACGEFVSFMDPDDWYPEDNTLELLYNAAKENNVKICGGSLLESSGGVLKSEFSGYKKKCTFTTAKLHKYSDYQYDYYYQRFIYDLNFLRENNIYFPNYRRYQDPPFFVKAMALAEVFYAVPDFTYKYRVEAQTIQWTDIKLLHMLSGLRDNVKLSAEMELCELHTECLKRLRNVYLAWFEKRIDDLPLDIINVLLEICAYTDISYAPILEDYCRDIFRVASSSYSLGVIKGGDRNEETEKKINDIKAKLDCEDKKQAAQYIADAYEKIKLKDYDAETVCIKSASLDETPDVSVVVPVYNVEDYLEVCLDSLLAQTHKSLEIICVNDGSKDSSLEILKKYAEKHSCISVYTHPNMGLSETRNCGVRVARGKYVYFMDSDDILEADALELLVSRAERDSLDVVYFDATSFSDTDACAEQVETYKNYYSRKAAYGDTVYEGAQLLSLFEKNKEYRTSACLQMVRRDFFIENSLWFARGILHEDNLFTFICLLSAKRAGYINRSFFNRRVREDSIMTGKMSFFNVYGYFYGFVKMIEFMTLHPEFMNNTEAVSLFYRQLDYAKSIFSRLDDEEQYSYMVLDEYLKNLFKLYISDTVKLRKEKDEMYGRLKLAWAEKSEVRARLQTAWDEKSELKRVLQRTYDEKFERGVEIKRLKKQIAKKDKTIARMRFDLKHPLRYLVKCALRFLHLKK